MNLWFLFWLVFFGFLVSSDEEEEGLLFQFFHLEFNLIFKKIAF